jgi:hypothetical protein
MVVVVGRLFAGLAAEPQGGQGAWPVDAAVWGDTEVLLEGLPEGAVLDNVVTGERVVLGGGRLRVAEVCRHWPGAVLMGRGGEGGPYAWRSTL